MNTDQGSFESIDQHVMAFAIDTIAAQTADQTTSTPAERLTSAFGVSRPILVALAATPFIPASWRAVVTLLIAALDEVTGSSAPATGTGVVEAFKAGKDL